MVAFALDKVLFIQKKNSFSEEAFLSRLLCMNSVFSKYEFHVVRLVCYYPENFQLI